MIFTEHNQIVQALAPVADAFAGAKTFDVVSMKKFNHFLALIEHAVGVTGTYKVQLEACSSAAGANNEAIPFRYRQRAVAADWGALTAVAAATGFTITAGSDQLIAVEADAAELPDGKPYLRLITTEVVDSPILGGVLYILSEPSYPAANLGTQLT